MTNGLRTRADINTALSDLTDVVLGAPDLRLVSEYYEDPSGTLLGRNPNICLNILNKHGPELLDNIRLGLADITAEAGSGIVDGDFHFLGTMGYLNWLIGFGGAFFAEGQITTPERRFLVAQPSIWILRNLDAEAIHFRSIRRPEGFEKVAQLDPDDANEIVVAPGQDLLINGFEEIVWPSSSGQFFLRLQSLHIGAYECVFDLKTGRRIGKFSPDIRVSVIENVLRVLGFAQADQGLALAERASTSALRELRWAALNYFWRTGGDELGARLSRFASDPDPKLRALAVNALQKMESSHAY